MKSGDAGCTDWRPTAFSTQTSVVMYVGTIDAIMNSIYLTVHHGADMLRTVAAAGL